MNIKAAVLPLLEVSTDWVVLGLFEGDSAAPPVSAGMPLASLLERLLASKDVSGGLGDTTPLLGLGGLKAGAAMTVGLGARAKFGVGPAFDVGVAVGKRLGSKPRESVAVIVPESDEPAAVVSALTAGIIVGTRGPGLRKSEAGRQPFGTLWLVGPEGALDASIARGRIVGDAINLARDLANTPPADKPPTALAELVRALATEAGLNCEVWDRARIELERFGGLLGVSAGSDRPPAFVVLEYRNGGDSPPLALVGKGVTFDSGGLSLKPSASMEDMKSDMTGAAVVFSAIRAAAQLGLRVNLVGYLALTENMTGGHAMKLGDVLTMRNGKTVEVLNTDAEGRLILADALSLAVERKPRGVIDLATLTGACIVALGTRIAGLFTNNEDLSENVRAASRKAGERVWQLPLDDDFKDALKSNVADLKNVGGKWGGAVTAAKFLEHFVGDVPWVHLDIAGPSWADSDSSTRDSGGTGCFVRTLIALFESAETSASEVPAS